MMREVSGAVLVLQVIQVLLTECSAPGGKWPTTDLKRGLRLSTALPDPRCGLEVSWKVPADADISVPFLTVARRRMSNKFTSKFVHLQQVFFIILDWQCHASDNMVCHRLQKRSELYVSRIPSNVFSF